MLSNDSNVSTNIITFFYISYHHFKTNTDFGQIALFILVNKNINSQYAKNMKYIIA